MDRVLLLIGSDSDKPLLHDLQQLLVNAGIVHDTKVASCHRSLDALHRILRQLKHEPAYRVVIALANTAANMPAIVAGYLKDSPVVVIGVGRGDSGMNGIDSLLALNTIPAGVPLATTGIGNVGLINTGLLAIKLLRQTA